MCNCTSPSIVGCSCGTTNIANQLRYALNVAYKQAAILGLHDYTITAIKITTVGAERPGVGGVRTVSQHRLTIGSTTGATVDGYQACTSLDGYLNPGFSQVSAKDIVLSGNILTDRDYKIGPLVFENDNSDYNYVNPSFVPEDNTQLYFYVTGPTYPNGQYFERIHSTEDSSLSYYLYIRATAHKPKLS